MKFQIIGALLCSTILSVQAMAGLPEAIQSFDRKEYKNAFAEFSYLAEEGDPTAVYYLGRMYNEGLGVDKDNIKALELFQLADKGYNMDAAVQLGKMMLTGQGMAKNTDLGLQYLKKAAYAGNEDALYELGNAYLNGTGVEKDYTYAFGFYLIGALKGDKRAQTKVGQAYLSGRGIPQDYSESVKWYARAANQGYVVAQKEFAEVRETNPRLMNLLDAYAWYSILAAYNSDEIGQTAAAKRDALGLKIKNTKDLTARQQKIREWRPISAADSVPDEERRKAVLPVIPGFNDAATTQQMLEGGSVLLTDGSPYGVTTDMINDAITSQDRTALEKAVTLAGTDGKTKAYAYYGDLLRSRFDDEKGAVNWYQKGADAGDAYAQYQLAKMYCEGRGVENPDASVCYGWLLTSAKTADQNLTLSVQSAILAVEAEATADELTKGKEFAEQQAQKAAVQQPEKKAPGLFNLF